MAWTLADFDGDGDDEILAEFDNNQTGISEWWMIGESSSTSAATPLNSTRISLGRSSPNPMFNGSTIHFELPSATSVRLTVFDVRGHRVKTLANGSMVAGPHTLYWDGTNDRGNRVSQGTYFYELKANGERLTRKMLVIR